MSHHNSANAEMIPNPTERMMFARLLAKFEDVVQHPDDSFSATCPIDAGHRLLIRPVVGEGVAFECRQCSNRAAAAQSLGRFIASAGAEIQRGL